MFQALTVFRDEQNGGEMRFFPAAEGHRFSWGDKLGVYRFFKEDGQDHLLISFNYAREETYLFTPVQMEAGRVVAFRMKDRLGKEYGFRKV